MSRKSVGDIPAAYLAASLLSEHKQQTESAQSAYADFSQNTTQISNNINGGAGYFAETHHAASFNVNQANAGFSDHAELMNSRHFGSIDILTDSGVAANPKYYATAEQSYAAGAELIVDGGDMSAKYAGQHIIVPQDQLNEVLQLHQQQLDLAQQTGDSVRFHALSSIDFSDHLLSANGVASTPLSYQEAQQGAENIRQGYLPEYAQPIALQDSLLVAGEAALMSTVIVTAVELAPALTRVMSDVAFGQLALADAGHALIQQVANKNIVGSIQQGVGKAAITGGLTFFTGLNVGLATFLVTFSWDVHQIYQQYQSGMLSKDQMYEFIKNAGINRAAMSSLTIAAVSVAGPIGLLAPILAQWLVQGYTERQQFQHGLNDVINGWMRTVSETAQTSAQQWQLAYNLQYSSEQSFKSSTEQNMTNQQQLNQQIKDFNQIIKSDELSNYLHVDQQLSDVKSSDLAITQLQAQNLLFLAQQQQNFDITQNVERFMIEQNNNRYQLERAALDALSILDPKQPDSLPRSTNFLTLLKQKVLAPMDWQMYNEHVRGLVTAQLAAMRMLQSLQNDQKLSIEFITLLQHRIHGLGHALVDSQQQQQQDLRKTYQSMALMYGSLREKIIAQQQRIELIERNIALHDWLNLIHVAKFNGLSYMQLPSDIRLCVMVNEFIHLTEGSWSQKELLILQEMIHRLDLQHLKSEVFTLKLQQQPALQRALFSQLKHIRQHVSTEENTVSPVEQLYLYQALNPTSPTTWLADKSTTTWDVALMLMWQMKAAGIRPYRIEAMEKRKQTWMDGLTKLEQLISEKILSPALQPDISRVKCQIGEFKLVVPLIGKFSVGKSTLLNAWLEQDIQPSDLGACTSLPTEFHYSEHDQQKVIVVSHGVDGELKREEMPLAFYHHVLRGGVVNLSCVQHIELHLHLAALAKHPDLILVDTPGLESNVGSHEKALRQYSGAMHSSFVLCASRSHLGEAERQFVLRQSMYGKPVSLLVCQEDLILQHERLAVRDTIAQQAEIDLEYNIVRGCSAHSGDLKGLSDILNHIEEQKTHLFDQVFTEQVNSLLALATHNLEQQLSIDDSREQLQQRQQQIALTQRQLEQEYEKQKTFLLAAAQGRLANEVCNTIQKVLDSRRETYYHIAKNEAEGLSAAIEADIQNSFELAVEQSVFPAVRHAADMLESAVTLQHEQSLSSGQLVTHSNPQSKDHYGGQIGGGVGLGASLLMGLSFPILVIPGVVAGWLLGEQIKVNQAKQVVDQQLIQVFDSIRRDIPDRLAGMVDHWFIQIFNTTQQRVCAEQDRITAIEQQLDIDQQARTALRDRLSSAIDEIKKIMASA